MNRFVFAFVALASVGHAATVQVPVLVQPVSAGARLEGGMLAMQEVDSAKVYANIVTNAAELTDVQTVRPLQAGKPISRLHVKPVVEVNRGSLVTLAYRKPGIELVGNGQALEDGQLGQSIRILNPDSRATVVGVVVGENQVEVR